VSIIEEYENNIKRIKLLHEIDKEYHRNELVCMKLEFKRKILCLELEKQKEKSCFEREINKEKANRHLEQVKTVSVVLDFFF
jgi:hypothetical protein